LIVGDVRLFKGIYPVRVLSSGRRQCKVVCLTPFLHAWKRTRKTNNESRMLKAGDELTVPSNMLWTQKRKVPTGKRDHAVPKKGLCD
jgi:hypothetical protein